MPIKHSDNKTNMATPLYRLVHIYADDSHKWHLVVRVADANNAGCEVVLGKEGAARLHVPGEYGLLRYVCTYHHDAGALLVDFYGLKNRNKAVKELRALGIPVWLPSK